LSPATADGSGKFVLPDEVRRLVAGLDQKIAADKSFPFKTETDPVHLNKRVNSLLSRFI
jgi:hypothetical protein